MKVVYISSSTVPSRAANSIHVMKMCQAFANNMHEVVLIAPNKKEDLEPNIEDVFDYYGVDQNFQLHKVTWPRLKGRGYIYGWLAAKASLDYRPDLIYCRNLVGCYFSAISGKNVIFESHAPVIDKGKVSELIFRRLIKRIEFQKLVVITHALKKYYEEFYPEIKGKIQVAPDGADPITEPTVSVDLPNKGKRIQVGYVGHLYAGKGMEIISELAKRCEWADFHIVGGTRKDLLYWQEMCKDVVGLTFHGYVSHKETQRYIKAFDVVLLPNQHKVKAHGEGDSSIGEWTSPLKAFEYMASGKPILASNLPVLREVLIDKVNSLLCDPENVDEWEEALVLLKKNDLMSDRLAQNAYKDFIMNYSWTSRAETLFKIER